MRGKRAEPAVGPGDLLHRRWNGAFRCGRQRSGFVRWLRLVDPGDTKNHGDEYANEEYANNEGADGHGLRSLFECGTAENGRVRTKGKLGLSNRQHGLPPST